MSNTVLVNGTGTIGEPLISLLLGIKKELGIDEVLFYKHTARLTDRPMLSSLVRRGGQMVVEAGRESQFRELDLEPSMTLDDALKQAEVVIDATKEGVGMYNKEHYYSKYEDSIKGFMAQGSESQFGKIYASGINEEIFTKGKYEKYVQIASCNTHAAAAAVKHFGFANGVNNLDHADLTFIRRASDVSQNKSVPAPEITKAKYDKFGTHHAKDVHRLFTTLGHDIDVFSTALKVNSQYMHTLSAHFTLKKEMSKEDILQIIHDIPQLAITNKTSVNQVFSFGRDHGYYGRILNQSVIVEPSIAVNGRNLYFWSMTPQDGNSILSSVRAALYYLYEDRERVDELMEATSPWLFDEV